MELQHYKQNQPLNTTSKESAQFTQKLNERETYIKKLETKYEGLKKFLDKIKEDVGEGQKWINQALSEAQISETNGRDPHSNESNNVNVNGSSLFQNGRDGHDVNSLNGVRDGYYGDTTYAKEVFGSPGKDFEDVLANSLRI